MKRQKASYTATCPTCRHEHDFKSRREAESSLRYWRAIGALLSKIAWQINPENPIAAAEAMPLLWKVLNDALPIIEEEAERRAEGMTGKQKGPYWNEMRELAGQIERVIRKATKKEGA
jgi:hypothetical protein